jgi:hypothetical protein
MTIIPLYCVDEHHQAFLAWWQALGTSKGVTRHLVHIDEHADFGLPLLSTAMPHQDAALLDVLKFAYQQLTVGTFLIPANHYGFFDRLTWIRPRDLIRAGPESFRISCRLQPPFLALESCDTESHSLIYDQSDWTLRIEGESLWMLDICLDAFACEKTPRAQRLTLEITRQQYEELMALRLDHWHARFGASVKLSEAGERFEFSLQEPDNESTINESDIWESACVRLDCMRDWLLSIPRAPQVVTLARSVGSGYTPVNLAEALEREVIEMLRAIYPQLRHSAILDA